MANYNIRFINPITGTKYRMEYVSADRIDFDNMTFRWNFNTQCEIVEISEASEAREAAKAAYFKQYGTANE